MASQKHLKHIESQFREMTMTQQKNFLSHLYSLSKENTDVFEVWLNNGEEKAIERLITAIEKETKNRIGRFRKMRVSKLNEIVKLTKKYPISDMGTLKIYNVLWENVLDFVVYTSSLYIPERYEMNAVKYTELYLDHLATVAEVQERMERYEEVKEKLDAVFQDGYYFEPLADLYMKYFSDRKKTSGI